MASRSSENMKPVDPGLPDPSPTAAYWQSVPHELATHQSPSLPSDADVVIIGSGITGASVAHHLLHESPGLKVVILEARTVTSGATGRNGGHCKDVPFKTYGRWKAEIGLEAAQRLVRFNRSHVRATRQLAENLRIEGTANALFRNVESVTAVFDTAIFAQFKENMREYLQDFPEDRPYCKVLEGDEAHQKYGIIGAVGILVTPAAALWPYRLITGLLHSLMRKYAGLSIEALTPVTQTSASDIPARPFRIHTNRGTIVSRHVVHCTNGHTAHLLPSLRGMVVPTRGQMTTLTPGPSLPRLGHMRSWSLYWSNGGFDYMSQAGDSEGHVYLGGGAEQGAEAGVVDLNRTDDNALNIPALQHLCSVLPKHFVGGQGTKLKQAWTGIMGFTPDGFPVVGKIPPRLGSIALTDTAKGSEWIAAGFNGYGMVHCWQSGRAVAKLITSGDSGTTADLDWFPAEQFAFSMERLRDMSLKSLDATFSVHALPRLSSRI